MLCRSVKFLRASTTLETFTGFKKHSESPRNEESGLSGEQARQFYENLLEESNEEHSQSQPRIGGDQRKSNLFQKDCSTRKPIKNESSHASKLACLRQQNLFLKMAQNGDIEGLQRLIEGRGIDINTTDQFGWTALMCATRSGQKVCVKFLLKKGARIDLMNNKNQTAEDIAKCSDARGLQELFHKYKKKTGRHSAVECLLPENLVEELCEICKTKYSGTRQQHNSSTAHLFNCQYKSDRTLYHIPENNIGFQLMKKKGWDQEKGLGPEGTGRKFPVKTILKQDRLGLGSKQKDKARVTHFSARDATAVDTRKHSKARVARRTSKRIQIQNQLKERKWEHDMRVYMNTE